jgi:hypothetical protein
MHYIEYILQGIILLNESSLKTYQPKSLLNQQCEVVLILNSSYRTSRGGKSAAVAVLMVSREL